MGEYVKNRRGVLAIVFMVYFCIDMIVGYAYWLTIQKINQLIGVYTYHFSAPAPLVNILLYRSQIDLFRTIPQFSMALFQQSLVESVVSLLLFLAVLSTVFSVLARRKYG